MKTEFLHEESQIKAVQKPKKQTKTYLPMTGLGAGAQAIKMANVDVISSYPIRPYTGVMMILAQMIADGELDAEFVHAEGEHAQLAVVHGACAAAPGRSREARESE